MQSRLIRIVADETPDAWGNWAAEKAHTGLRRGFLGRFAPTRSQIKSAGATVAVAASGVLRLFSKNGAEQIEALNQSQVADMIDAEGSQLSIGTIYAVHPLVRGTMLKADTLHSYIIKEQRAQIIRYFRTAVALKSLTIEVLCQNSGKYYAGGGWKIATVGGGKSEESEQRHWFTATYSTPRKEEGKDTDALFWMPYFDEIIAATKDASGGSIESITTLNTSFGISAEAASLANIDANWISNQSFLIKAEYA